MSGIDVSHLTFYYEGSYETIFEDVSFSINTDWKLGFVGRNGRGKTTFLNLLLGKYEYNGTISSSVLFDYFPYAISDKGKNTIDIVEEIYPGYEFWELCREWSYLKGAEDVWFRPFESLSNGEQTKVLLAVLFLKPNHFLLIDEPTNHLDMETRELVCSYLKQKSGFILVSHDRKFLDGCVDHILSMNRTNIEVVQGNFSSWWENKRMQDAFEEAENERLKKDIRRLSDASRQAGNWADQVESAKIGAKSIKNGQKIAGREYIGEKSRRMQKRRKNLEHRMEREIDEKGKLLKNIESSDEIRLVTAVHHKEILIRARDMSLSYGTRKICRNINFELRSGDCLVLNGRNGCGKSSVIRAILAAVDAGFGGNGNETEVSENCRKPAEDGNGGAWETLNAGGMLETASGLIVSYVPQDTSCLTGSLQELIRQERLDETLLKQFLRKLDFSRTHLEKPMEQLSEGQKKKVLLAKSLCSQAHVYLWDEPLNFVDIFSRIQLEDLILKYRPAMILIEHDRTFVERVATRIVDIKRLP